MDQVKYLQGIYNNTLEHVLITKVNRTTSKNMFVEKMFYVDALN